MNITRHGVERPGIPKYTHDVSFECLGMHQVLFTGSDVLLNYGEANRPLDNIKVVCVLHLFPKWFNEVFALVLINHYANYLFEEVAAGNLATVGAAV